MENSIENYKPQVDLSKLFVVDETLPDNELTFKVHRNIVTAIKISNATFLGTGKMLKLFKDRKLYKFLDFENFEDYLASEEVSFSREKAYLYIRIYELFIERLQMGAEDVSQMGVVRLQKLVPILRGIEDNDEAIKKIDEYRDLRYNDFIKKVASTTNADGKPNVYWSEETQKWIVQYFEDKTHMISLGLWKDRKDDNS